MTRFSKWTLFLCCFVASPIALAKKGDDTHLTRHRIEISGEVLFETGSAQLKPDSSALLSEVAKVMKDNPKLPKIQIGGHTDDTGAAEANKALSKKRADAVRRHLVSLGVDKSRLATKGYGESRPIAPGTSAAARSKNRRVDFVLIRPISVSVSAGLAKTMASGADGWSGTTGLLAGPTVHYGGIDLVKINLGVNYAKRGAKSEDDKVTLSYIDLPLTAHYSPSLPFFGGFEPHVGGGLRLSLLQSAKLNDEEIEAKGTQNALVIAMGGTYEIPFGMLWVDARYNNTLGETFTDMDGLKLSSFDLQVGMTY